MSLKCKMINWHKFSKWKLIDNEGKLQETLERKCKRCDKVETYHGLTSKDILDNSREPYIFTDM